jgi:hypothetical protein
VRGGSAYKIVVGAIVGVVLACAAVAAVAATSPSSEQHQANARRAATRRTRSRGLIAVAASYLRVSKAQLRKDLHSGKTLAQVAQATGGKSEAGLIAAVVASRKARSSASTERLEQHIRARINRVRGAGPGRSGAAKTASGKRPRDFAGRSYLGLPAAQYLGVTAAQLQSELQSGKTLAQVAQATSGKSEAGLIAALVAARKESMSAAVTAGQLTQAQATKRDATLTKRITALVNRPLSNAGSGRGS